MASCGEQEGSGQYGIRGKENGRPDPRKNEHCAGLRAKEAAKAHKRRNEENRKDTRAAQLRQRGGQRALASISGVVQRFKSRGNLQDSLL